MVNAIKLPKSRNKQERQEEIKTIISTLTQLQLTIHYEPIKKLFNILQLYSQEGGTHKINIPFPLIEKRIKGLLPDSVNEKCWVKLVHEKF